MNYSSPYLIWKLILVYCTVQLTLGIDILEYQKRQRLIPFVRLGRAALVVGNLTVLENKGKEGGMIPFPRLGRSTLMPFPRTGRVVFDSDTLDYDNLINPDYSSSNWEDSLMDNLGDYVILQKRPNVKLIPRIGRKKRSVHEESRIQEDKNLEDRYQDLSSTYNRNFWNEAANKRGALIPRVGRAPNVSVNTRRKPQLKYRSRVHFIPRIGRSSQ